MDLVMDTTLEKKKLRRVTCQGTVVFSLTLTTSNVIRWRQGYKPTWKLKYSEPVLEHMKLVKVYWRGDKVWTVVKSGQIL